MTAAETLAFGKQLVEAVAGDDSRDTLMRWMLHRIADLIKRAETASSGEKHKLEAEAAQAILEVWGYRSTLRTIDPLADLTPILQVIRSLDHDNNPWFPRPPRETGALISDVYSSFRSLIISFLLQTPGFEIVPPTNPRFLSSAEKEIQQSIDIWLTDFQRRMLSGEFKPSGRKKKTDSSKPFDAKEELLSRIRDARETIEDLERAVKGEPPVARESKYERLLRREPQLRVVLVDDVAKPSDDSLL